MLSLFRRFILSWLLSNVDKVKDDLIQTADKATVKAKDIVEKAEVKLVKESNLANERYRKEVERASAAHHKVGLIALDKITAKRKEAKALKSKADMSKKVAKAIDSL